MEFLNPEELLGADAPQLAEEVITIRWKHPKTGKLIEREVIVREPTVEDKTEFETLVVRDQAVDETKVRQALIVTRTFDRQGKRVFKPGDVEKIAKLGGGIFEPIVEAAMRLGKTSNADITELAKKSEATSG